MLQTLLALAAQLLAHPDTPAHVVDALKSMVNAVTGPAPTADQLHAADAAADAAMAGAPKP